MNNNKFALLSATFFSISGLLIGIIYVQISATETNGFFPAHSAMAGFISAYYSALFLNVKKNDYSTKKIIIAGSIAGIVSHWICWYFLQIQLNFEYHTLKLEVMEIPPHLFDALYLVFAYCLKSIIFVGWATIGTAILSGFLAKKKI